MPAARETLVEIEGHRIKLSNLDKVLYPEVGFTKAEVIDYYVRVAPTMLAHVRDRGVTLRRFPNGVHEKSFFEKRCPKHRPDHVTTLPGPGDSGGAIDYCHFDEVADLAWAANMAALEIHAPMARGDDLEAPTMCVFDLDPGEPAGMQQCAEVGLDIHDLLLSQGLESFAKTSGSKGLQLYVPLNTPHTHDHTGSFALMVAQALEKHHPDRIVSSMRKDLRKGKVLIDWSQNSRHKTTVAAYSLRARPEPTVSTPVSWDEVADAAEGAELSFEAADVLERVEDLGDLFAPTPTLQQQLPPATGRPR